MVLNVSRQLDDGDSEDRRNGHEEKVPSADIIVDDQLRLFLPQAQLLEKRKAAVLGCYHGSFDRLRAA